MNVPQRAGLGIQSSGGGKLHTGEDLDALTRHWHHPCSLHSASALQVKLVPYRHQFQIRVRRYTV
jgi:hypothetical protein